ncbi:MAG: diguanylate cyclase [Candidatus Diapherotrites archaeon]|nr:diguanylate cyclase [Candidatus Diapherotrites archaeon]
MPQAFKYRFGNMLPLRVPARSSNRSLNGAARLRRELASPLVLNTPALRNAQKYALLVHHQRIGSSPIRDPFTFNTALKAAERAAFNAQRVFSNPRFQERLSRLPEGHRVQVKREYLKLLKLAASMRKLSRLDLVFHRQSPAVLDRRSFNALLIPRLKSPRGEAFSIGMLDFDHFKKRNTRYGHLVGDVVIKVFTERLARLASRHAGFGARVGGEEFQVFLPVSPRKMKAILDEFRVELARETTAEKFERVLRKERVVSQRPLIHPRHAKKNWEPLSFTAGVTGMEVHNRIVNAYPFFHAADVGLNRQKARQRGKTTLVHVK